MYASLSAMVLLLLSVGAPPARNQDNQQRIVVRLLRASNAKPVAHPMVCVRELHARIGFVGDSAGWVAFGGNLPKGKLQLQIVSPSTLPIDTSVVWPPAQGTPPLLLKAKERPHPLLDVNCPPLTRKK